MKLDLSQAWQQTTAFLGSHGKLLIAVAGIFILLPQIVSAIFFPQPQPEPGATPQQMMDAMSAYSMGALPILLLSSVAAMIGTLAMLKLLLDPARPTVGDAIKAGASGFIPYFLSQMLLGLGFAIVAGVPLGLAIAGGLKVIAGLLLPFILMAILYVSIKLSFVPALIADTAERNPINLMKQSWVMTKGNSLRIFAFILLVGIVFFIGFLIANMIAGLIFNLAFSPDLALKVTAVFSAILLCGFSVLMAAMVAAMYRQLGGSKSASIAGLFE